MNKRILIELQYLGPVRYYQKLAQYELVLFEGAENYVKSSFRNRCYIAGPNGRLRLTIPLDKGKHQHTKYKDVKIVDDPHWQKVHWQSLCSCYRKSPYFEFYEDEFHPFYHRKTRFLFDLNLELTELLLQLIKLDTNFQVTKEYKKDWVEADDLRSIIHPNNPEENPMQYHQVFQDRTGFIPDASVIDLLFNYGPATGDFLRSES